MEETDNLTITKIGSLFDSEGGRHYFSIGLKEDFENTVDRIWANELKADSKRLSKEFPDKNKIAKNLVLEELEAVGYGSRSCSCSHDCCGHNFYMHPELLSDPIRGYVMIWSFGKNI